AAKIGGAADRRALRQQLRAAYGKEPVAEELTRREPRRRAGVANGEIGLACLEPHYPVRTDDRQRDPCVRLAPQIEPRYQPSARERIGRRDAEGLRVWFSAKR